MPHVVALYRYPVKGFTPEECDTLTVLDEGRIAPVTESSAYGLPIRKRPMTPGAGKPGLCWINLEVLTRLATLNFLSGQT